MPLFEKEKKEGKTYFSSYCAYLYFYIFKAVFGGYGEGLAVRERLNEFDGLPILFIDGKFAPEEGEGIRFYSSKFKNFLDERDYCKFVEFDQCTHWGFFQDRAKQANDTIYQFLQK